MIKGVIDQGWGGEKRVYEVMIFINFIHIIIIIITMTLIIMIIGIIISIISLIRNARNKMALFLDSIACELLLPTNRP